MTYKHEEVIMEFIQRGAEFAEVQAPLLAADIITYGYAYGSFLVGLGLIFGLAGAALMGLALKTDDSDVTEVAGVIGLVIFFGGGCTFLAIGCSNLVKVHLAPRLYLLEQLTELTQ